MTSIPDPLAIQSAINVLSAHPDYRVLRRFQIGDGFGDLTGSNIGSACFIDFETTGINEDDFAIEIGLVQIQLDLDTGRLGNVISTYSGFEDPGFPLPEEVIDLTGITDDDVCGQAFDDVIVKQTIQSSQIVVAHNAKFDRGFAERRFEFMKDCAWGCSMQDVPWARYGIGSGKLEFIAFKTGYFYDAHRAVVDSEVTAGILAHVFPDGKTGMSYLLEASRVEMTRVWAFNAPFEVKDVLKGRGYSWVDTPGATKKSWGIETRDMDAELQFLKEFVYPRGGNVLVEKLSAVHRFTSRGAGLQQVRI